MKLTLLLLACFYYSFGFGQIKFTDLNVDTTITGFHFAANFQGTLVFTINGSDDLRTTNPTAFSFTIAQNLDSKIALNQFEQLMQMSIRNGYKVFDIIKKDTTLNGNNAYYTTYTETYDAHNYKNLVFNAFVVKDKTLIVFTSGDINNGQYIEKFKKTFYNIKL